MSRQFLLSLRHGSRGHRPVGRRRPLDAKWDGCRRTVYPGSGSKQQGGGSGVDGFEEEEFGEARRAILERLDAAASRFNTAMQGASAQNQSLLRRYL